MRYGRAPAAHCPARAPTAPRDRDRATFATHRQPGAWPVGSLEYNVNKRTSNEHLLINIIVWNVSETSYLFFLYILMRNFYKVSIGFSWKLTKSTCAFWMVFQNMSFPTSVSVPVTELCVYAQNYECSQTSGVTINNILILESIGLHLTFMPIITTFMYIGTAANQFV